MAFKLFAILLGALCWLINTTSQVNIGDQRKTTNFTIHWHFENKDELINITKKLENLEIENKELLKRLQKVEERLYCSRSCADALANDQPSGIYMLQLRNSGLAPFNVFCLRNATGEEPWTIIQRRQDGSIDFYREWKDYVNGFGDANGEYWLGLQRLHKMTNAQPMELWVKLGDNEGETRSAFYDQFVIGDENEKYKLKTLGKYSGDAGDSLNAHRGNKFTTKDQDNDTSETKNCAVFYTGAWWFNNCHNSNLNGKYGDNTKGKGVVWHTFKGSNYSLKYVHMAIRPRLSN